MPASTKWYAAVLVLECVIAGKAQAEPELQVRLVEAPSHEDAYARAVELGAQEEQAYRNESGEEVSWHFRGLSDLNEILEAPKHGAEVYWMRSKLPASELVRARDQLSAFWLEANKHKTARQILEGE
jgi:hypothetical protein